MHGTEVACLFKLGHYGKTCKCFFFPVSTSRVEKVLLHEINYRSIISQSLQEAFCLTVQLKMFHSHLFVLHFWSYDIHTFSIVFYEIFWGVLAVFFHRYFLWCWKQERGRENRKSFFVCNWLCKRSNELSLWSMSSWCTYNIRVLTVQVTPSPKVVSGGLCS